MPEILHDFQFPPPKHWEKARENELTEKHDIYREDLEALRKRRNESLAWLTGILEDRIGEINRQIENPPEPAMKSSENASSEPTPKV